MTDGFKSTEFWLTVLVFVAMLTRKWTGIGLDEVYAMAGLAGFYTGGRSLVKAKSSEQAGAKGSA